MLLQCLFLDLLLKTNYHLALLLTLLRQGLVFLVRCGAIMENAKEAIRVSQCALKAEIEQRGGFLKIASHGLE